MHPAAGVVVIVVGSALALLVGGWLRTTLPQVAVDALMALAGALIAVGGLLMLDDVNTASWIAGPRGACRDRTAERESLVRSRRTVPHVRRARVLAPARPDP